MYLCALDPGQHAETVGTQSSQTRESNSTSYPVQEEMIAAKESLLQLCRLMDSDQSGSLPTHAQWRWQVEGAAGSSGERYKSRNISAPTWDYDSNQHFTWTHSFVAA